MDSPAKPSAVRLTAHLCGLVRNHDLGALADLRRIHAISQARLLVASYAPTEADREVYERVAFLFARYHAGKTRPSTGWGSIGNALGLIGAPGHRGPKNPGTTRLLDRITTSRDIPWRHLQHAVERARAADTPPPEWVRLTDNLTAWHKSKREVAYRWARDFYTPAPHTANGATR
ncbi:type I-E CRISPR-associated protein Cse2/CasB [Nocardia higoensis]|uniref:Type I-E CRISPR-associated protein Cse2/CasB n=1 Tax=Nocardia higoensis TaxID=228599 RepID=A0ABS0DEY1_9NOCA|nr:type I-E CRISPR-associated protein Cse2/CasB [Nocardia higoensis]